MKPVINEAFLHLFSFLSFRKFGNIKDISFIKILCVCDYKKKFVPDKNVQMIQFSYNIF